MLTETYYVIGVMSGTSLDGVDLAYMKLQKTKIWSFEILEAETLSYTSEWKQLLQAAIHFPEESLKNLDDTYTIHLSKLILDFIKRHHITQVEAVCSHGHTVKHKPQHGYTLQIGNRPTLAKHLRKTVVCDFRVQDVALGGQGAPLVPIGDQLLFSAYDYCLNLGGFANVSTKIDDYRIAYDICPVNTVLNHYAEKLGKPYDADGQIAAKGTVDKELLQKLNNLGFYSKQPPKSLGIEWVNEVILPLLDSKKNSAEAIIATFTEHCAIQIAKCFKAKTQVLVTGGGSFNSFLIKRIRQKTSAKLILPQESIINYKEALIFGLLGVLKLRGETNTLASVTGASKNHSAGNVFYP